MRITATYVNGNRPPLICTEWSKLEPNTSCIIESEPNTSYIIESEPFQFNEKKKNKM